VAWEGKERGTGFFFYFDFLIIILEMNPFSKSGRF
jgi:hypothetical protein